MAYAKTPTAIARETTIWMRRHMRFFRRARSSVRVSAIRCSLVQNLSRQVSSQCMRRSVRQATLPEDWVCRALESAPGSCSKVAKNLIDEAARIRKRQEMAARHLVNAQVQSFFRHAPLELDRKEPIVTSGDHMDRNLWPRREAAGLTEHDVRLGALVPPSFLDDLGRNVVQEVCADVELRAVTAALRRRFPICDRSRVVPPLTRRLAGNGNHGVDEHQHFYGHTVAHHRGRKRTEGLGDENNSAVPDRLNDSIGVCLKAGVLVVAGQVDRSRLVSGLFEERHHAMPVARNPTGTGHENERSHALMTLHLARRDTTSASRM